MESLAAGRGDARRRSGRQVGQRRRRAPHLMQSAFRKRAPRPRSRRKRSCALSRPLCHPPAYRASSPLDFVPAGGRHSAIHRGPAGGVGKSPPEKAKPLAAPNSDVEAATERSVAAGGNSLNDVFPERMGLGGAFNLPCLLACFLLSLPDTHFLSPSRKRTFIVIAVFRQYEEDSWPPPRRVAS